MPNHTTPPPPPPPPSPADPPRPFREPADKLLPPGPSNAGEGGGSEKVLRRTVVRPAGLVPDPVDSAYVASRLTALTHELSNLLDGSMRTICLARRALPGETDGEGPGPVSKHLETVYAAMLQMAELVRHSLAGLSPAPGGLEGMRRALGAAGPVGAAVRHAVNVMLPLAEERGVELRAEVGAELDDVPAGQVYAVVTGAVRNAVEAIERGEVGRGRIDVRAWVEAGRTGRCVVFEVMDNGVGPPAKSKVKGRSVFEYGVSGKNGGSGIGLALCREVVEGLGGTIELLTRTDGKRGAVLRVRYPAPGVVVERVVG